MVAVCMNMLYICVSGQVCILYRVSAHRGACVCSCMQRFVCAVFGCSLCARGSYWCVHCSAAPPHRCGRVQREQRPLRARLRQHRGQLRMRVPTWAAAALEPQGLCGCVAGPPGFPQGGAIPVVELAGVYQVLAKPAWKEGGREVRREGKKVWVR